MIFNNNCTWTIDILKYNIFFIIILIKLLNNLVLLTYLRMMGTGNENIQEKKDIEDAHDQKVVESNQLVNLSF